MQRTILVLFGLAVTNQVIAHPSVVAHDHPHGVSLLGGLDSLLAVALILMAAWLGWKMTRR